ncbi:hypothetical protein ABPG74_011470 [Tetrahymena malaccensis]
MKKFIRNFKDQQNINKHLFCSICHEVFRRPVIIACGHTFCKHCIQLWKVNHKFCPNCRQTIQKKDNLLKNLIPQQIIDELEMNCASEECAWTGQLQDLEKHYSQCQFFQKIKQPETNQNISKAITIEEGPVVDDGSDVEIVEIKDLQSSSKNDKKENQSQNSKVGIQKAISKPKIKSQSISSSQLESDYEDDSNSNSDDEVEQDSFSDYQNKKLSKQNDKIIIEEEQDEVNLIKDVRKKKIKISYEKQEVPKSTQQNMEIEMQQNDGQIKQIDLSNSEEENKIKQIFFISQNRSEIQFDKLQQKNDNSDCVSGEIFNESQNEKTTDNQINPQNLYHNLKQNLQLDEIEKNYSTYLQKFSNSQKKQDKNEFDDENSDQKDKEQLEENTIFDNSILPFQCVSPNNPSKNECNNDENLIKSVDQKQPAQQSINYLQSSNKKENESHNLNVRQFSPQKFDDVPNQLQNSNKKLNPDQDPAIQDNQNKSKENEQIENINSIYQDGQQISLNQSKQQQNQQNLSEIDSKQLQIDNQNSNNSELGQNKIQQKEIGEINKEMEQEKEKQNVEQQNEDELNDEEEEESKCNRIGNNQQQEFNYELQNVDYKQYEAQKLVNQQNQQNQEKSIKNNEQAGSVQENKNNKQEIEQQKKKNPIIDILFGLFKS